MFWSRSPEPPDPATLKPCRVLLASEGRKLSPEAVAFAADLARGSGTQVRVLSFARIWGTSLGIPAPGLLPNKQEWQAQRDLVADAVRGLKRLDVAADGHVLGARNPTKFILREAQRLGVDAIVMGGDGRRPWLIANMLWSQEPYRVQRRAKIPVYVVEPPAS
jgi:nucleotide-binding universal stress UspA family protein